MGSLPLLVLLLLILAFAWIGTHRRKPGTRRQVATTTRRAPVGTEPGDVTRYLCTAAYVDERFADRVADEVLADELGAIAPSVGVDLTAVVRHCLKAKELRYGRDLKLVGSFAAVVIFGPAWLAFAALLSFAGRAETLGTGGIPGSPRGRNQKTGTTAVARVAISLIVLVLLAFMVGVTLSSLPLPGLVRWLFGAYLGGVPAVLALIGAMAFGYLTVKNYEFEIDQLLRTTMSREAFTGQAPPAAPAQQPSWITERLTMIGEAQAGNVTVYSGYTPFVGYANAVSSWSLTVPLLPARDAGMPRGEPEAFTTVEVVDYLRERLRTIGDNLPEPDGEHGIFAALSIEDRVFVSGTTVGDDNRFTPETRVPPSSRLADLIPAPKLSQNALTDIMRHPTGTARHYLGVHVPLWGGDVVPSVFLHFSVTDRTLHLNCSNHILGPVAEIYHLADVLPEELTPERRQSLLLAALPRTFHAVIRAPFAVLHHLQYETRHTKRIDHDLAAIEQDPLFDHGARVSIREMALSSHYHNYFQVLDARRIVSAVERHTFAALRDFLDTRGFDITDFQSQQSTILNNGIIQQGGVSVVGNQAVGTNSSATQNVNQPTGNSASA